MANQDNSEIISSRQVVELFTAASEFCRFVENADTYTKEQILEFLQKICPVLYAKGCISPDISPVDEKYYERYVTEEHWENVFNSIKTKLDTDDKFYIVEDDGRIEPEASEASIAENIADIYQDLKDFVILFSQPLSAAKENAIFECRLLFETRWGIKIINIQQAVHHIIYRDKLTNDGEKYMP